MAGTMRLVNEADVPRILEIYAPIVLETSISFEYEVPGEDEMRQRIQDKLGHGYPWLVLENDEMLLGYAYAGRWRDRAAYNWTVETTVYVNAAARRGGIGRTLYGALFQLLRAQGFVQAVAGVTLPNEGSVGLHQAVGFVSTGVTHHAGYKFGQWWDVGFFEMNIQAPPNAPAPTQHIAEMDWKAIVGNS